MLVGPGYLVAFSVACAGDLCPRATPVPRRRLRPASVRLLRVCPVSVRLLRVCPVSVRLLRMRPVSVRLLRVRPVLL